MHRGCEKRKHLLAGSIFTGYIFPQELSRVDSARAMKQGVY